MYKMYSGKKTRSRRDNCLVCLVLAHAGSLRPWMRRWRVIQCFVQPLVGAAVAKYHDDSLTSNYGSAKQHSESKKIEKKQVSKGYVSNKNTCQFSIQHRKYT